MLEERLQQRVKELRVEGRSEDFIRGFQEACEEAHLEFKKWQQGVALKLIAFGSLSNEQVADVTELSLDDVKALTKSSSC